MERDDCSTFAIHDLAALAEGNLSPDGMERLAAHLPQCRTCMATLVALVDEAQPSKGSGNKSLAAWLAQAVARGRVAATSASQPGDATPLEGGSRRDRS